MYHKLLIICGEKVLCFSRIALQPRKFLMNFCDMFKHDVKGDNRKSFLGNEVKCMEQQNIFTVNNKQYKRIHERMQLYRSTALSLSFK